MFFDIGPLEMVTIFVIAIVVLGPEKLPKAISEISAFTRKVRSFSDSAQADIRKELGPELADLQQRSLQLRDLHPQALAQQALTGAEDETRPHATTATKSVPVPPPA
ncbi:Sec-independent protein translocase protein TatB [Streptomyces sp. NBC_01619]|uniref:Sec-independent protein translocase protein TatB n=1 Tax=Streptomyces pratisoli TaxID=3139917 RepID=A0ACC6Q9Q5_9ACTN|nr:MULTISPECIES: Sec-independent protein translocase protein TatB [unclassified Streptomyces]MCX4511130.1 Sec-independent protein translocase protein TatB [Streptomyces sp. NBC_01619]